MKVFIIDDDSEEIEFMIEALYEIHPSIESQVCTDPEAALVLLAGASVAPDIILLDNMMPTFNAVEVIDKLMRLPTLAKSKIVVLSSDVNPNDTEVMKGLFVPIFKKDNTFSGMVETLRTIILGAVG